MLLFHTEFPEPADENIFAVLQGLLNQLKKGVDYLGRLNLCENVLGEGCFHDLGFGESHGLLQNLTMGSLWDEGMIPYWLSEGKDRAVKDGVNASMQVSRETCSDCRVRKHGSQKIV